MRKTATLLLLLLILLVTALTAIGASNSEVIVPSTIGELSANVKVSGSGVIAGLKTGEDAIIEAATFQQSENQKLSNIKEILTINDKNIYPSYFQDEFGNKMLRFRVEENGEFNYEISADINNTAAVQKITDYKMETPPDRVAKYIQPTEKIESESSEILTLAKNKIYSNNFAETLNDTMLWVNGYVEYATGNDFRQYYLEQRSAVETLIARKGVCDEFANLGAAILRAKKIPTRIAIGTTYDGKQWGSHAWIEVYNQKLDDWIPSDPTFNEAGFVDAMHVKMGSFDDVTSSKAKCTYPSGASCVLDTQKDMPIVKILSKNYFSKVKLSGNWPELKAYEWNELEINFENTTDAILMAPSSVWENYDTIKVKDRKKSILLDPKSTKKITYEVLPLIDLGENQIAKGTLTINSISSPLKKDITISKGDGKDENFGVIIKDLTPIAQNNSLRLIIDAENYYTDDQKIAIHVTGPSYDQNYKETIPSMGSKTLSKVIVNYKEGAYKVEITTPTQTFEQTIVPVKPAVAIVDEPTKPQVIEKQIEIPTQQKNTIDLALENPVSILIALLMGVAVLLFGLMLVNKRYV